MCDKDNTLVPIVACCYDFVYDDDYAAQRVTAKFYTSAKMCPNFSLPSRHAATRSRSVTKNCTYCRYWRVAPTPPESTCLTDPGIQGKVKETREAELATAV
jgi:hypothetical protein